MEEGLPSCEWEGCRNVYVPRRSILFNLNGTLLHICDDCYFKTEEKRLTDFFGTVYKYPLYQDYNFYKFDNMRRRIF